MIKRKVSLLTAAVMLSASFTAVFAAQTAPNYYQQYVENFEDSTTVFGDNGIVAVQDAADEAYATVATDATTGNGYLSMVSSATSTDANYTVEVRTKAGAITSDVSVITFKLNSTNGNGYPSVSLRAGGNRIGRGDVLTYRSNGAVQTISLLDGTPTTSGEWPLIKNPDTKWYDVRIELNKTTNTIKTSVAGFPLIDNTATIDGGWTGDVQVCFTAGNGKTMNIDDLVISDGYYADTTIVEQDFEHAPLASYTEVTSSVYYFPNLLAKKTYTIVNDTKIGSYANILPDTANSLSCTLYTGEVFESSATRPVIIEYSLKTDATTNTISKIRTTGGSSKEVFHITAGQAQVGSKAAKDVSDGNFHDYKLCLFLSASGNYNVSVLVDGVWIGNASIGAEATHTTKYRADIEVLATSGAVGVDNYKIYYPVTADVKCNVADATDVATDAAVVLSASTPINYSSDKGIKISYDVEGVETNVEYAVERYSNMNQISIKPTSGSWEPNTTYTISTGTVKDMYDTVYNKTFTFTTGEAAVVEPVVADVTYTIGGVTPAAGTFTTGEMSTTLNLTANTADGAEAIAYAAQYNSLGELIGVSVVHLSLNAEGTTSDFDTMTIGSDAATVKIMLWDGLMSTLDNVEVLSPAV